MSFVFVVPDWHAAISGGNFYNERLVGALRAAGAEVGVVDRDGDLDATISLVDSFYLDDFARLKERAKAKCYLLAHVLPSLVAGTELSNGELAVIAEADGFVVPSEFMAAVLAPPKRTLIIAPGVEVPQGETVRPARETVRGILVANLVPEKGVLPFLEALAPEPKLELVVVGSHEVDPAYAAACQAITAEKNVRFLGPLDHSEMLTELQASDVFVSASRMETFGMALAEARALGLPIVARFAGNAAQHVDPAAGGRLVETDSALAAECVRLATDRAELERRQKAAASRRPPPRSWADAAREFVGAFSDSDRPD